MGISSMRVVVELFDVVKGTLVVVGDEVDRDALTSETATASDPAITKN